MGSLFSSDLYTPKYKPSFYTKRMPNKNEYKIDNENVYWRGDKVNFASGITFTDLGNGYGKDMNYVFHDVERLPLADTLYFIELSHKYAKDSKYVYYKGDRIIGADAFSFNVDQKSCKVTDKYNKYRKGKPID